ncbi:hypothetical protein [Aquabacterium sp. OR-4]|uniref:hypothetical protein n=1 Tax=Aquabacterium sp. OR-4 TaxID=2978127 RepID=UPI0028C698DA|nr:hypothetical protein [Aquabacterium sp. OR-4]MDT7838497.1 hypothetical protein [Aquabacterium sp. OR-4]
MTPIAWLRALTLTLATTGAALAADKAHGPGHHDHQPQHGGVVVGGREFDHELVARPEAIRLYVRGHGQAVNLAQASARLVLLNGSEKQEVTLLPAGGDRLEATGSFKLGAGTKAVAALTIGGRAAGTVRFVLK